MCHQHKMLTTDAELLLRIVQLCREARMSTRLAFWRRLLGAPWMFLRILWAAWAVTRLFSRNPGDCFQQLFIDAVTLRASLIVQYEGASSIVRRGPAR